MARSTIKLTPVVSKQLSAYGYDPATQTLAITFHQKAGTESIPYHYPCTPDVYDELCKAESKGQFFNRHIKSNPDMPHTRMAPDEDES